MMTDWSEDLSAALASGEPEFMTAMLSRVPTGVLQRAAPYLDRLAQESEREGRLQEASIYRDQLVRAAPDHVAPRLARARLRLELERYADALGDAQRLIDLEPERALGYRLQGEAYEGLREWQQALAAYRQALHCEPDDESMEARVRELQVQLRKQSVLQRALDPEAAAASQQIELSPLPQVSFDPALFDDPSMPESLECFRVQALAKHLWRYSGQQAPRDVLARLDDPVWLEAWNSALSAAAGRQVLFWGSELGVLGLRALHHGAAHARCVEPFPLAARIATGMIQKHFLSRWHERHGAAIQQWSEEERRESFQALTNDIDVVLKDDQQPEQAPCDLFVFPRIDHTLLGTGIVKAIRQYRASTPTAVLETLPATATLFAMGIQWCYPTAPLELQPLNRLRWSPYPQPLELEPALWKALTAPAQVGEIDFANFQETDWEIEAPVVAGGSLDAVVFWFELDLGNARISNAPGSDLRCLKPAVQYTDPIAVAAGQSLSFHIQVRETRLHFRAQPPARQLRSRELPGWYIPMLGDRWRNDNYRQALENALRAQPSQTVLDIGAGCGLLSMMAARAGAEQVVGCEIDPELCRAGAEILQRNHLDQRIALVNKDCRRLSVPGDLPRRADLALFELFDCSLIGEGILHYLTHARAHLLTEDARYLPAGARLSALVIEYRLDRIWDIDANLLNPYRYSPSFINVDAATLAYRPLTEPFQLFAFDFRRADSRPQELSLQVPATAPGPAGAVLFWFDLQLDETTWISNAPDAEKPLHWKQGLQFLPELRTADGMKLPLLVTHDGSSLKCQWQRDEVPREAYSTLPRFDPRWLAASSELDQQTRSLLQHCAGNPEEHAKVVEIAKRFAVNPAAYDLDPVIAQRFAAMLFGA